MAETKVSLIIQALDRVTAPVRRINKTIASIAAPARQASRSLRGLFAETGMKRVSGAVGEVGKRFDRLTRTVRGIAGAGLVVSGVLAGLGFGLTSIANSGDAAAKSAHRFGVTIADWQRLAYAGKAAGLEAEELGQSLGKLGNNAVKAATGNQEAALWFRRAGVDARDQNGRVKKSTQLLAELADVFAAMPDGPKKVALSQALMNNSSKEMIDLLNGGSKGLRARAAEAERLGLVNEQAARAGAAFNANMDQASAALQGLGLSLAGVILPVLSEIVPQITDWIAANRELIAAGLSDFIAGLKQSLPQIVKGLGGVFSAIGAVARAINAVVQFFGGWQTVIYAVAGVLGAKLVFALLGVAKAVVGLGLTLLTTPVGWFLIAIAAIAGAAYLIYKNWEPIKEFFAGLWDGIVGVFGSGIDWIKGAILKLDGILPDWVKKFTLPGAAISAVANRIRAPQAVAGVASAIGGRSPAPSAFAPAPSALTPGAGTARVGGEIHIKLDAAPGLRARVTKQEARGGIDLGVETGYAMAGAG